MKNKWEYVDENTIKIWLQEKDGERLYALISAEDFDLVNSFDGTWYANKDSKTNLYYVYINVYGGGKGKRIKSIKLHRLILGLGDGRVDKRIVDHINRNPLDNRRENLRICTPGQSVQNRAGWSSSGYRGVHWHKRHQKWVAHVQINGKLIHLGYYDTPEEAAKVVSEYRKKHLPFSVEGEIV